jgi:hypothetical protein
VNFCIYPPVTNGIILQLGDPLLNGAWRGSLQLAPNGKIYVANYGANSLGVISNPNDPGSACNYSPASIPLGTVCGFGLPNFYTPYFEKPSVTFTTFPVAGPNCQTLGFFTPTNCVVLPNSSAPFSGYIIDTYQWNFGDPSSGSANTSSLASPTHSFSAPGNYTINLSITYMCGRTDLLTRTVTVYPGHSLSVMSPTLSCGVTSATAIVTGNSGAIAYSWLPSLNTGSVANNLSSGTYTVNTTDLSTGCITSTILPANNFVISNSVNTSVICA